MMTYYQLDSWEQTKMEIWIKKNGFENIISKMVTIIFEHQCVKAVSNLYQVMFSSISFHHKPILQCDGTETIYLKTWDLNHVVIS